jgi:hypothetical protein
MWFGSDLPLWVEAYYERELQALSLLLCRETASTA